MTHCDCMVLGLALTPTDSPMKLPSGGRSLNESYVVPFWVVYLLPYQTTITDSKRNYIVALLGKGRAIEAIYQDCDLVSLGFRGLGFKVYGLGFRVQGSGCNQN